MKRKEFLNLSTRATLFFGLTNTIDCSLSEDKNTTIRNDPKLGRTGIGSTIGLTASKIEKNHTEIITISDTKVEKLNF